MSYSKLALFSSVCLVTGTILASQKRDAPLPAVDDVDLSRYQGKWFEIARLPTRFERACAADVSAEYSLREDGNIRVVNSCKETDGQVKIAKGIAKLRNPKGPKSQLKVSFFWPFYGDYWILHLDRQYRWALVGTPDRHYLWILSREPELAGETYTRLLTKARTLGFDTARVIRTRQSAAAQSRL
jgi:apolipoprotein D and lipocalin family protein